MMIKMKEGEGVVCARECVCVAAENQRNVILAGRGMKWLSALRSICQPQSKYRELLPSADYWDPAGQIEEYISHECCRLLYRSPLFIKIKDGRKFFLIQLIPWSIAIKCMDYIRLACSQTKLGSACWKIKLILATFNVFAKVLTSLVLATA